MDIKKLAAVATLWTAGAVQAQTVATIEGAVTDPTGAVIRGAEIVIRGKLTNDSRRVATDERGRYLAASLEPGIYSVEAAHPGFRRESRDGIRLDAGRTLTTSFTLQVGATQDRIVVTGETPLVSLAPTDWGTSTERRELESLPMRSRDVLDLVTMETGVNQLRNTTPEMSRGQSLRISVNGGRPNQNSFRLDGVYMNDATATAPASASAALLGVEGIQELRLVTSPFSAEYGRAAAGSIVAVTRSGSNEMHGSAYELFRNNATDARNFFDPPGAKIPPLRRNQFGGLVGGPIVRDRLFFLGNYEGLRQRSSAPARSISLGAEAREGRLPTPSGGFTTVTVSPVIRPYFALYPLPNGQSYADGTGEYIAVIPNINREDYMAGKANWILSERLRLAARHTADWANHSAADHFLIWNQFETSRYHVLHTELQWLQSPATIHAMRFGASKIGNDENLDVRKKELNALEYIAGRGVGRMLVTGLAEIGTSTNGLRPRIYSTRNFQINDDVQHMRGAQTWKVGGSFDLSRLSERADRFYSGQARFTSISDFLQARPRTADFMMPGSDTARNWSQRLYFGYVQHETRWRRASLSWGVRYETFSVPSERDRKTAVFVDPYRDPSAVVGLPVFSVNPSRDNFAPRVSLAWDPSGNGKTVIRAGAGIFFDLLTTKELTIAGVRVPPIYSVAQLQNPPFPNIYDAASRAVVQNAVDSVAHRVNQPYATQYQFAVQRQVGGHWLAQLSYNGTHGTHLTGIERINIAIPQTLADGRLFFPAGAPKVNPAVGTFGIRTTRFNSWYHSLNAMIEQRWTSRLRYQFKYTWSKLLDHISQSVTNDFVTSQHNPHPFNHRLNYGRADYDVRHVAAANFSYQLPGLDRPGMRWILDGWEVHGLVSAQTGFPFSPNVGFDRARLQSGTNDMGQRPNQIPGARAILGDPAKWFDPLAFSVPDEGYYGYLGKNTFDAPGVFNVDAAVHKVLFSTDRHRLHLRVESFNVTNHPNFKLFDDSLPIFDSTLRPISTAGRINQTSTPARQIQFALKWTF